MFEYIKEYAPPWVIAISILIFVSVFVHSMYVSKESFFILGMQNGPTKDALRIKAKKFEINSSMGKESKIVLGNYRICAISRITVNLATDGGQPKTCEVDIENDSWYLYARSQKNASIQCSAVCI